MDILAPILAALCAVWLLQAALVFMHLAEIRTLAELTPPAPPSWPRVSALVPSRNEAHSLETALASRLSDDYPDLEVIVIDDRSSDATRNLLKRYAENDVRVRAVRVEELPERWLGKVHALATGVEQASGDWLLVSDADIHFEPGTLKTAVAVCEAEGIDFLALVPEFRSSSRVVDVLWAAFIRVFCLSFSPAAVRNPASRSAVGSGSFMLVRRTAYDRSPGFEWLRMETADDMALGMMMKRSGARCDFMNARGSIRVSIYTSLGDFYRGVEKNAGSLAAAPFAAVAALLGAGAAVEFAPLVAIGVSATGASPRWLLGVGLIALALQLASSAAALHLNTGRFGPALWGPFAWLLMASGILRSAWIAKRRGGVVWRETFYPLADLLEGQRFKLL